MQENQEHTDVENEGLRDMMTHILQTKWNVVEVIDEHSPVEYDWYVTTVIKHPFKYDLTQLCFNWPCKHKG